MESKLTSLFAGTRLERALQSIAVSSAALLLTGIVLLTASMSIGSAIERNLPNAQSAGRFTGEYANGSPVYRLPPVTVIADRKIAASEAEERSAHVEEARAQPARKQPG